MYSSRSGLILGFHGCDQSIVDDILLGRQQLKDSENVYDWLGHGAYFWEYSPSRALEFAKKKFDKPAVIGAAIDLGFCLDLLDYQNLAHVKDAFNIFAKTIEVSGYELPENKPGKNSGDDLLIRHLDCAVIQTLHQTRSKKGLKEYDSVRGVFWEGKDLYPNAGLKEKNHIQICIRNPNCIKGFFHPRILNNLHAPV